MSLDFERARESGPSEGLPEFPEYGFSEFRLLKGVGGPRQSEEGLSFERECKGWVSNWVGAVTLREVLVILKEAGDPGNLGKRGSPVILKGVGLPVPSEGREYFVIPEEESLETVVTVCLLER